MAIAATGRPSPEVVQPRSTSTPPLSYAAILKSPPTNPNPTIAVENGHSSKPLGLPTSIPSQISSKPIQYLHGEPTFQFSEQELEVTIHHQELQHSVVGKFSHGWPEIQYLRTEIPKQCELKAEVKIGLLCNQHVLIPCSLFEDYVTLMSKPCFLIQENRKYHSMRTFKWEPWFSADEETRHDVNGCWKVHPDLMPEKAKEGGSGMEKETIKGNPKPISSSAHPSCDPHIPPTPATNPTTENEWVTVRRKTNKNLKQKQPPNPPKNSGVNTGTVIPVVLAIGNTVAAATQPIATQNPIDNPTGIPPQSDGNQRITANSPTETLADTPENPTRITNPTRPGNPTQTMTHQTPSAPLSEIPLVYRYNPPPPQTLTSRNPFLALNRYLGWLRVKKPYLTLPKFLTLPGLETRPTK
ncbi:hypothetical protein RND71_040240 [Anisodus tanguticus]|uniref:DUF4283 domain-containing protein n=1 Tax=Anisodus tanguticus TaxID=243964 RepID=A0AAE1QTN3_9SOLA|nr:hypothetical protein RND71_040240 [Anisodus tanguticus]